MSVETDVDLIRKLTPPEYSWNVGPFSSESIRPEDGLLVEALMCVALATRDSDRRPVRFRPPPAYLAAIIHIMRASDPLDAAAAVIRLTKDCP